MISMEFTKPITAEDVEKQPGKPIEAILAKWYAETGSGATIEKLIRHLHQIRRRDVIEAMKQFLVRVLSFLTCK